MWTSGFDRAARIRVWGTLFRGMLGRGLVGLAVAGGLVIAAAPVQAADGAYDFAAPPSAEANRVYSVNRKTGEMSACQFERPDASAVGVTRCFQQGEGAGPQKAGAYALVPTRYAGETGIFRVNIETGEMSICYVRELAGAGGAPNPLIQCTALAR